MFDLIKNTFTCAYIFHPDSYSASSNTMRLFNRLGISKRKDSITSLSATIRLVMSSIINIFLVGSLFWGFVSLKKCFLGTRCIVMSFNHEIVCHPSWNNYSIHGNHCLAYFKINYILWLNKNKVYLMNKSINFIEGFSYKMFEVAIHLTIWLQWKKETWERSSSYS